MDMKDPASAAPQAAEDPKMNEAVATEADATSNPATDIDPEAAVEEIMTEGETAAEAAEESEKKRIESVEDVLAEALAMMAKEPADIATDEIRRLRQLFTIYHPAAAPAEGEEAPAPDQTEMQFNAVIDELKARKAAWTAKVEAERAENLARKNAIIEEILSLADDTDNVNRTFPRYRELQDEFNAIGEVDPTEETAVWKRFQEAREKYSDNLKINKELRDYDFKKNLAEKEQMLAEAIALAAEEDVIAAYRKLQEIHNRWRQVGPVAKELRDDIWNRFREASAEVNKRYQAFFEERKTREAENEAAKTALCERIEALDYTALKNFSEWDEMTRAIVALQEEWRKIGFASKKVNRQLFARFRKSCDAFFAAKTDHFRTAREELAANLARKQALTEKAEALKESTDWREATEQFVAMQKEWKTIGSVPKKYSDSIWERFTAACDYFFERKKKAGNGARSAEAANLRAKREIIGKLSAIVTEVESKEDALKAMKELQQQWQEIGHVPFREKDKLYETYRSACDEIRKKFAIAERSARRERFEASVASIEGDNDKIYRERERMLRTLEGRRNELRTYQNNLGFLSSKSKNGDSLLRDMSRRIDNLKADIAEIEEKIKLLDSKL